jgi:hypothetical protein
VQTSEYSSSVATTPGVSRACPEENFFCYDLATNTFIDPVVTTSSVNQSIDPDYQNPYTDQFIASLERELVRDLGLSLHYVREAADCRRDVCGSVRGRDDRGRTDLRTQPVVVKRLLTDPARAFTS